MRQMLSVQFVRAPTTKKRYYAREELSLTRSRRRSSTPARSPVVPGARDTHAADVRARTAPLTVGDADPATRESRRPLAGFMATTSPASVRRGPDFRAPVAGRYRVSFSGYTIWVGPGRARYRFANGQDRVGKPQEPEWFRPNGDDVSPGRRLRADHRLRQGRNAEPAARRIRCHSRAGRAGRRRSVAARQRILRHRRVPLLPLATRRSGRLPESARAGGRPAGVAFRWMEVEGPLYDESTTAGYKLLFGDLPLRKAEPRRKGRDYRGRFIRGSGRGRGGRNETQRKHRRARHRRHPVSQDSPRRAVDPAARSRCRSTKRSSRSIRSIPNRTRSGCCARSWPRLSAAGAGSEVQRYLGLIRIG
jgi:hypothetical protein